MPLEMLDLERLDEWLEFNEKIYPKRHDIRERFGWYMLANPFLSDKKNPYVLLYRKDGKIVGQSLLNPFKWHFRGKAKKDYFGIDWYVLKENRGPIGTALAMKTIKDKPHYFGIGFSESAKNIWNALGVKTIGSVDIFAWVRAPVKPVRLVKRIIRRHSDMSTAVLPERVELNGKGFGLIESLDSWEEHPWEGAVEFSRPAEFLIWRFFGPFKKYYFYMSSDMKSYFVLRKSHMKGMWFLVLVDYRVPFMDKERFDDILKAAKRIAKASGFDGILAGSSHSFFDSRLKRRLFIRTRRGGGFIMTNAELGNPKKAIEKREFVYATIADSDMDLVQF